MKDHFSAHADQYAKYRPAYPSDFFDYLNALLPHKGAAWDCGTGNGQVAYTLAKTFEKVFATDIIRFRSLFGKYRHPCTYTACPGPLST